MLLSCCVVVVVGVVVVSGNVWLGSLVEGELFTNKRKKSARARYFVAFQSRPPILKFGIACLCVGLSQNPRRVEDRFGLQDSDEVAFGEVVFGVVGCAYVGWELEGLGPQGVDGSYGLGRVWLELMRYLDSTVSTRFALVVVVSTAPKENRSGVQPLA